MNFPTPCPIPPVNHVTGTVPGGPSQGTFPGVRYWVGVSLNDFQVNADGYALRGMKYADDLIAAFLKEDSYQTRECAMIDPPDPDMPKLPALLALASGKLAAYLDGARLYYITTYPFLTAEDLQPFLTKDQAAAYRPVPR